MNERCTRATALYIQKCSDNMHNYSSTIVQSPYSLVQVTRSRNGDCTVTDPQRPLAWYGSPLFTTVLTCSLEMWLNRSELQKYTLAEEAKLYTNVQINAQ